MASRMILTRGAVAAAAAAAFAAGCHEAASPLTGVLTHLVVVSGSDQTGDVGAALASPLVVQALDGANHPVGGAVIAWTVTGSGTISPESTTTDAAGMDSVRWTLGPRAGVEAATASAARYPGVSATFLAGNGAVIMGNVAVGNPSPTGMFALAGAAARARSRAAPGAAALAARHPRTSDRGIVVVFRSDVLRLASAGSAAYRATGVARAAADVLTQRLAAITRGFAVQDARVSPAILAAHVTLADRAQQGTVLAALQADPAVAWAGPDAVISIRDGAPAPQAARPLLRSGAAVRPSASTSLPNSPDYFAQAWGANMVDLPRAWAVATGSPAVTVAVVDMGVRFDDPALAPNLTTDGYDFVEQIPLASFGYDSIGHYCSSGVQFTTIDGNGGPHPDATDPDDVMLDSLGSCWSHNPLGDHGQWTSGIIGAAGNNNGPVTGVNWSVRIRPIRVLGITGDGIAFDVAQGVLYAAGLPALGAGDSLVTAPSRAPIINLSLGSPSDDPSLSSAVAAAVSAGCLVVASAGNSTWDLPTYPAAYPGVIGVSAVGMDGQIASYSNAGTYVAVAAPGGEFRLDDNGGDGVLGLGWDFTAGLPTLLFGYGTSAAAPYVSGVAALLLGHQVGLTAAQLTARIEQYASRPPNASRDDNYGWGIVDAYNALVQQSGPVRRVRVELFDASGALARAAAADSAGAFVFANLSPGTYHLMAGEDEDGDGLIGLPGRRLGWDGGVGAPVTFSETAQSPLQTAGVTIGMPMESEPNDQISEANSLDVNSYVVGNITPPDVQDVYGVSIPTAGQYTFETSGVTGSCGFGLELDTKLVLTSSSGVTIASNDDEGSFTGPVCSKITTNLSPGRYYVTVTGSTANSLANRGRYRLQVRSGT